MFLYPFSQSFLVEALSLFSLKVIIDIYVPIAMKLKKHLLLGRKVMTNLDSILKSRDITLPTKVRLVKAMEKAVATHSSTLAWKIPSVEEPGRLKSIGSRRVGDD